MVQLIGSLLRVEVKLLTCKMQKSWQWVHAWIQTGEGTGGPDKPWKITPSPGAIICPPAKRHLMAFRWWEDGGALWILVWTHSLLCKMWWLKQKKYLNFLTPTKLSGSAGRESHYLPVWVNYSPSNSIPYWLYVVCNQCWAFMIWILWWCSWKNFEKKNQMTKKHAKLSNKRQAKS